MEEWKECKLGEIATITKLAGFEFTKYIKYNETGEIIALRALNLRNGRLDLTEVKHIDKSVSDALPRSKLYKGEILFTYTGNGYGDCALVDEDDKYHLAPNICKISPNKKIADSNFLFQTIRSNAFYKQVSNYIGGSSQPTIPMETIRQLKVKLPPLPTQQKIAAILSSLDDKIELNNKINTNLEQQAQALFKNWFVDFEPFGGKMPEGWKVGKLSDILCLKKNPIQPGEDTSLPYLPIDLIPIKSLAIREVRPNEEALSSLLRFDENDILIGAMRVYFHRVAIAPFDGITRTTCFVLEPFNPNYFAYAAITCNQDLAIDYAQKTSKGSTMPYAVWEGGLGDFEIPIPDEATAEKFNNIVKPLLEQIKQSYFEDKTLQELRESLLPKLMNGEIETNFNIISKE